MGQGEDWIGFSEWLRLEVPILPHASNPNGWRRLDGASVNMKLKKWGLRSDLLGRNLLITD